MRKKFCSDTRIGLTDFISTGVYSIINAKKCRVNEVSNRAALAKALISGEHIDGRGDR